jgi:hypothetical protein
LLSLFFFSSDSFLLIERLRSVELFLGWPFLLSGEEQSIAIISPDKILLTSASSSSSFIVFLLLVLFDCLDAVNKLRIEVFFCDILLELVRPPVPPPPSC